LVLAPSILLSDLFLFLGSKIVLDVEMLANFIGGLSLQHIGDSLAAIVEKPLDVHVVGSENERKKHRLLHIEERLIPLGNVIRSLLFLLLLFFITGRVFSMLFAPRNNHLQSSSVNIGKRNGHLILYTDILIVHVEV
ncbi:hypothetical protein PFISCL1PPCAC_8708, partial [Pristionchus fissidentatus]